MNDRIGFVGLGHMGRWIAVNLLKNGFDLMVFDIEPAAVAFVTGHGAQKAASFAETANFSPVLFFCLPNQLVIEKIVSDESGLLEDSLQNRTWVDLGTSNYIWTKQFAGSMKKRGLCFIDAPVTGMEQRAKDGTLTIMIGGEKAVMDKLSPALKCIGSELVHMGKVGSGQLAKTINNVLLNVNLAALAELLPMAVRLGLEPDKITRVINSGSGQSFASQLFLPRILENDFNHGYALNHAYKDMENICEISSRQKIPIPVVHAALSTYQAALAAGFGEEDKGAMMKVFESLLEVRFRSDK